MPEYPRTVAGRWYQVAWAAGYDLVCGHAERGGGAAHRRRLVEGTSGTACELGIGTGRNVPLYARAAAGGSLSSVVGIDPQVGALLRARRRKRRHDPFGVVALVAGSAQALPLPDASLDTVVASLVLCSVPDVPAALAEARRVLRPDGTLRFYEHVLSREPRVARWQTRLTPAWRRIAGNCHLDRDSVGQVEAAGFEIERLEEVALSGAPAAFRRHVVGAARPTARAGRHP